MTHRTATLIAALVLATLGGSMRADEPAPPRTYTRLAPGGRYLFVMLAPMPAEAEAQFAGTAADSIRALRLRYARSGLYANDGSAAPLWTVDWYAAGIDVSSDGVHLIRHGPWASATSDEALSFFADGRLLRSYRISELVDNERHLRHTVSHFFWEEESRFDDARSEYALTTVDGNRFVFDVRTGAIVSESRPGHIVELVRDAILAVLALALAAWLLVRRRRERPAPA